MDNKRRVLMLPVLIAALAAGCWLARGATMPAAQFAPRSLPTAALLPQARIGVTPIVVRLPSPIPLLPASPPPAPQPTDTITPTTLAAAPDNGSLADVNAAEHALAVAINDVRAQNGLGPYTFSDELSAAAQAHSCDLAAHGMISHTSSDGRSVADRLAGAQPPWQWPSESIAVGTSDIGAVVAMWMDEPPEGWHRRNILDGEQREVGVGYCFAANDPSGNHHYWTADFSRR